ncbi:hypothetical protein OUZ56_030214 [Daphnia magna]|uniref:Uncharacterized protein n=1 Tax=Daphnia magna TaxID=35525 RepID=A0ABQ9ZQN3_9CRUS|nr:hypothetical protein OUZ56_030214 [Daphnia magna]
MRGLNKQRFLEAESLAMQQIEEPKPNGNYRSHELEGPYSPLEMRMFGKVHALSGSILNIEADSVNSVLLDDHPEEEEILQLRFTFCAQIISLKGLSLVLTNVYFQLCQPTSVVKTDFTPLQKDHLVVMAVENCIFGLFRDFQWILTLLFRDFQWILALLFRVFQWILALLIFFPFDGPAIGDAGPALGDPEWWPGRGVELPGRGDEGPGRGDEGHTRGDEGHGGGDEGPGRGDEGPTRGEEGPGSPAFSLATKCLRTGPKSRNPWPSNAIACS